MLEVLESAEVLPIGILQEPRHNGFVALVEGVLELVQPDQSPDRVSGMAHILHLERTDCLLDHSPINLAGKHEKRMLPVENLIQTGVKQFTLVRGLGFLLREIN